jgi:hypothetical protein
MKFIPNRFKTKKYWKQYLSWEYLKNQTKLGNEHYEKTLKELLPTQVYTIYKNRNPLVASYITIPFAVVYIINEMFNLLPNILSFLVCLLFWGSLVYLSVWEVIVGRYTLPNWKKFIVRNSPIQDFASTLGLAKMVKNPVAGACVICVGVAVTGNSLHKEMWPDSIPPAVKLGELISKTTGYVPTPKK